MRIQSESTIQPTPPFHFGCAIEIFPNEEVEALLLDGGRLEQLADGTRLPETDDDRHFLEVHRNNAEPRSLLERAWKRLIGRRELEREDREKIREVPTRPEDYGMIAFDQDRCWW